MSAVRYRIHNENAWRSSPRSYTHLDGCKHCEHWHDLMIHADGRCWIPPFASLTLTPSCSTLTADKDGVVAAGMETKLRMLMAGNFRPARMRIIGKIRQEGLTVCESSPRRKHREVQLSNNKMLWELPANNFR